MKHTKEAKLHMTWQRPHEVRHYESFLGFRRTRFMLAHERDSVVRQRASPLSTGNIP